MGDTRKLLRKRGMVSNFPTTWSICFFIVGFVMTSIYNHFAIKNEVKSLLKATESDAAEKFHPMQILHKLVDNPEETDGASTLKRVRRQIGNSFEAAHLVGDTGRNVRDQRGHQMPMYGNYFRWTSEGANSFSLLELDERDNRGTLILIKKKGFYLVYSQVLYNGHGLYRVGHETVRISFGRRSALMTTLVTQQLSTPSRDGNIGGRSVDSGFHAGVFYLFSGDRIGVKPTSYNRNHTMGTTASYFGVCFLWGRQ